MNKKIIIGSVVAASVILGTFTTVSLLSSNDVNNQNVQVQDNSYSNNVESEQVKRIDIEGNFMFGSEPTLEFLTKDADIIAIVSVNDLNSYITGRDIYTNINFNVKELIKSDSSRITQDHLTVKQIGGKVTVEEMRKNLSAEDLAKYGIDENESARSIVYFDTSKGLLDIKKSKEYLVFLNYEDDGTLMFNSLSYGIREIQNNKVFDYDTQKYVENELLK